MNPAPYVGMKLKFINNEHQYYHLRQLEGWYIQSLFDMRGYISIINKNGYNITSVPKHLIWDFFAPLDNNENEEML